MKSNITEVMAEARKQFPALFAAIDKADRAYAMATDARYNDKAAQYAMRDKQNAIDALTRARFAAGLFIDDEGGATT